jgi:very-short-patch-repair endonuclease
VTQLPDPDWYLANVLADALPGRYDSLPRGPVAAWCKFWRGHDVASDRLVAAAAAHGFVLTIAQLSAFGVSGQNARSAVRRGDWTRAGRGYVAPVAIVGDTPVAERKRHAVAAAAAALSRIGEIVSGRSAAVLHGLPTFAVPAVPELPARRPVGLGSRGVSHVYGAGLDDADVVRWYGIPETTVPRTLVDLARHDRRDAIMAADAALRERVLSRAAIDTALANAVGWPGVRQARTVLALASPLAESPLESLTRLALHDDGFPTPELQVWIGGYRVDTLFRDQRLILEVDGLEKYTDEEWRREKRRALRLRALDYRVERVGWDDIVLRWPQTRVWLRAALHPPT